MQFRGASNQRSNQTHLGMLSYGGRSVNRDSKLLYLTSSEELVEWYKNTKDELCTCITCQRFNTNKQMFLPTNAELHHLDPTTKCDTVFNLVKRDEHPGMVMSEMLKCVPLCTLHHKEYHRADNQGQGILLDVVYDFDRNPRYLELIQDFREGVKEIAPASLLKDYRTWSSVSRNTGPTKRIHW